MVPSPESLTCSVLPQLIFLFLTSTLTLSLSLDSIDCCMPLPLGHGLISHFTFNCVAIFLRLHERGMAKSPKGNHSVAILIGTENYDDLKDAWSDICEEVENLTTLNVDGLTFPLEYFLCSDLKFHAIICGIESATSTYPCIWCTCSKSEGHDMDKTWSIEDVKMVPVHLRALYPALVNPKPSDMVVYMHHCFPPFPLRTSFLMYYIFYA